MDGFVGGMRSVKRSGFDRLLKNGVSVRACGPLEHASVLRLLRGGAEDQLRVDRVRSRLCFANTRNGAIGGRKAIDDRKVIGHRRAIAGRKAIDDRRAIDHRGGIGGRRAIGHRRVIGNRGAIGHRRVIGGRKAIARHAAIGHHPAIVRRAAIGHRTAIARRAAIGRIVAGSQKGRADPALVPGRDPDRAAGNPRAVRAAVVGGDRRGRRLAANRIVPGDPRDRSGRATRERGDRISVTAIVVAVVEIAGAVVLVAATKAVGAAAATGAADAAGAGAARDDRSRHPLQAEGRPAVRYA